MEGLAAAASVVGVASLALQLAGSVKKLHDFWDSVKEAPEDVRSITSDLQLLSSVLSDIASEAQHVTPDHTLEAVMERCVMKVKTLNTILNELEPGFASSRTLKRKWTALKNVLKSEKVKKFQTSLQDLKTTLILVLQKHD